MPRPDLLALTADDLVTLSNRGLVRRAQQEVEAGVLTCELTEDTAGNVEVRWSDDVACTLPAGATLAKSRCTCPATALCRHLLRSVLAYQNRTSPPRQNRNFPPPLPSEWDPGAIRDEELAKLFSKAALTRARTMFNEGQVIELTRSRKPSAQLHTLALHLRFLVPGDARYTHCDCAQPAPCPHVLLAVWAFRLLPPEVQSGLVSTHAVPPPVPTELLDAIEITLAELAIAGISAVSSGLQDRLHRTEARCRRDGLIWPAELLGELSAQCESYARQDARFDPARVVALVAEAGLRLGAIRGGSPAAPPLFVRGSPSDKVTAVGAARLIGLGCGARASRGAVELTAYLQDSDTGRVVAIRRTFADPSSEESKPPSTFSQLADTIVLRGASLREIGAGQLLVRGGKRTPGGEYQGGRAQAALSPQPFAWEKLRAPLLVEDYAELQAQWQSLPPAALRPRRIAESLRVVAVAKVSSVAFSQTEQAIVATLHDANGSALRLFHPYIERSHAGTDALLDRLRRSPDALRFVSGEIAGEARGLTLRPVALIWEMAGARTVVQPWVERPASAPTKSEAAGQEDAGDAGGTPPTTSAPPVADPTPGFALADYFARIDDALAEQLTVGLERADDRTARQWKRLYEEGLGLGFADLMTPLGTLADRLAHRSHVIAWDAHTAAQALLATALLTSLAASEAVHLPGAAAAQVG